MGTASTASTEDGFEMDEDEAKRWEAKLIFSRFGQSQMEDSIDLEDSGKTTSKPEEVEK